MFGCGDVGRMKRKWVCHGAVSAWRVSVLPKPAVGAVRFVEMNPNFDMTSVIVFDELQPETHVEYQFGFFFSEVATRNLTLD